MLLGHEIPGLLLSTFTDPPHLQITVAEIAHPESRPKKNCVCVKTWLCLATLPRGLSTCVTCVWLLVHTGTHLL